jgi:ribosomal protein L29
MAKKPETKVTSKGLTSKEIAALNREDLNKKALELRTEIVSLKRGNTQGDVQNVHAYTVKRRELARVLTTLSSKGEEEKK